MTREQYDKYRIENSRAAGALLNILERKKVPVVLVHHNDADGLSSAASLSLAFSILSVDHKLLPIEKVHELIVREIHAAHQGCVIYMDLGGQSSELIGKYSSRNSLVIILDHHLPGGKAPENVIHLNPEHFGLSGDMEISGAAVSSLFARELLQQSSVHCKDDSVELALFGVLGAFADGQLEQGALTGVNEILLAEAMAQGSVQESAGSYRFPGLGNRKPEELIAILNLLGSVGFYTGEVQKGVDFLLGNDQPRAIETASRLLEMKQRLFDAELKRIRDSGLAKTAHVAWVDVKDRFLPMGVKTIGLFLEHLIEKGIAGSDRYLVGFQHFPDSVPGIGNIGASLTKISARVPPGLREKIEQGILPDFMRLIPETTGILGGIADGCHRFSAAALITRGWEEQFVEALENILI